MAAVLVRTIKQRTRMVPNKHENNTFDGWASNSGLLSLWERS